MTRELHPRSGAQVLVDQLRIHGADTVFGVPGESYLSVLDALRDANSIRYVVCRHEGAAAAMAEAGGKLTGRPGLCFVTRGPGATHASIGVHTAFQDSTPMILFVGQIERRVRDREAFQEVDYRAMFGKLAKWVVEIDDAGRVPELISQAFHRAVNGRPGPVVVSLPKDMLSDIVRVADAERYRTARPYPHPEQMAQLRSLLAKARLPIVIAGGAGWSASASRDLTAWAEANVLPVACAFRRQDAIDNNHPCFVGDVGVSPGAELAAHIRQADLVVAVGPRLGDITTGAYGLFEIPRPRQTLVHVHVDGDELGRVYNADLPIHSGMVEFLTAARSSEPISSPTWSAATGRARAAYLAHVAPRPPQGSGVDFTAVVTWLRDRLPADAIVANGAGNYAGWVQRFHRYRGYGSQLAPTSGAMGYGVPAAIAAKLRYPDRVVIAYAGDGCFLMTGQELATAVQYGVAVIVVVVNNGMYGTIRMHQERTYPNREYGTALVNPDFAVFAQSFGAFGVRIERTADFPAAFEAALASGRPAVIEIVTDPDILSPTASIAGLRA
ncbi:MAG: thiamine pyrophosphate-binding protein [Alphaproteobacteria bacterium]|nr:thiamine pyrophosphate-binding protein [Alphaproteobacteria bacterium]